MLQNRFNNLAIININYDISKTIDREVTPDSFPKKKIDRYFFFNKYFNITTR